MTIQRTTAHVCTTHLNSVWPDRKAVDIGLSGACDEYAGAPITKTGGRRQCQRTARWLVYVNEPIEATKR